MLQHLFTKVVPVPQAGDFWHAPMRYALQLDVILLLKRLLEHFASSAFAINTSREFDGVKIVVAAVVVTIADVFLRKIATGVAKRTHARTHASTYARTSTNTSKHAQQHQHQQNHQYHQHQTSPPKFPRSGAHTTSACP